MSDDSRSGDVGSAKRLLAVPGPPRLASGVMYLEDHTSARTDGAADVTECTGELLVVEEHLRDVPGHRREVRDERREDRGVAVEPPHEICARLRARDVE